MSPSISITRRSSLYSLPLVVALSLVGSVPALAQNAAWFGLNVPSGLGDPHQPVVDVSAVNPAPASVPAGEEGYADLRGAAILPMVQSIVDFSIQSRVAGEKSWGRVTGFPAAKATLEWTAQQFRDAGLTEVAVQEYDGTGAMWWPQNWEAKVLGNAAFGAGSMDVVLGSALPNGGSEIPGGTLTAPLAFAGHVDDPLPTTDLTGKVAVQLLTPAGGAYSERGATRDRSQQLMAKGAVAVLNVVRQTGNMHVRDFANCNGPCFNLGTDDGEFLMQAIEKAAQSGVVEQLQIQLSLQASALTGLKGHNAMGIVRGRSTENIIVNAHADGWFDAAGDNADGLAVLIAMARHFARPENMPERTLVFVASGGHHSSGLNGPANFVSMNPALTASSVLALNLEHIAQFRVVPGDWNVESTEQPMGFGISNASPFLTDLTRRGVERYGFRLNPDIGTDTPGDLGGYRPLNIPMVQAIHSGPLYHTSGDVFGTISVQGLERAARFYVHFVEGVANATRAEIAPQ
ncbi:MAG: M28 family peptidase [Pseudomonadota bacterium]